jgi:hypothetical protein
MGRTEGKCKRVFALVGAARMAEGRRRGGRMYLLTIVVITSSITLSNREVDQ